jgi:predicted outer membrane repeat protein
VDASTCHFPPPWSVEETDACFRDHNGQAHRRSAVHLLTRDDAPRIAANIAKAGGAISCVGLCSIEVNYL